MARQPHGPIAIRRRRTGALVILFGISAAAGAWAAEPQGIAQFYGSFAGSGVVSSRDSSYLGVTIRDLDVTIRPLGQGFEIIWTTVIRRRAPDRPKIRRKSQRMAFVSTGRPDVYRSLNTGDPLSGRPFAWARLHGKSLFTYVLVVTPDGAYEMQRYARTLTRKGMAVQFQRLRDGESVRTVEGHLVRQPRN